MLQAVLTHLQKNYKMHIVLKFLCGPTGWTVQQIWPTIQPRPMSKRLTGNVWFRIFFCCKRHATENSLHSIWCLNFSLLCYFGDDFLRTVRVFFSAFSIKRTVQQIDFTSFYLVRLRFTGWLLVPLRGLLIHSHIVCIIFSRTAVSFTCNIVCEN